MLQPLVGMGDFFLNGNFLFEKIFILRNVPDAEAAVCVNIMLIK